MSIRKPSPRKPSKPRPKTTNPFGLSDVQWRRLELSREHQGQWVAWAPDGITILAAGESLRDVDDEVQRSGQDVEAVVFERIEPPQLRVIPAEKE
jgi:hypothetical protein